MQPKILIVEDDSKLRTALAVSFQREKMSVIEAPNGEEGLKLALSEHPDVVLLDMLTLKMSGLSVLEEIRRDPWGKNVPVIILTNVDSKQIESEAHTLGVTEYLTKSNTNLKEIVERVKSLI